MKRAIASAINARVANLVAANYHKDSLAVPADGRSKDNEIY
jgi:hypothetical protein